jgi:hypothetical protein
VEPTIFLAAELIRKMTDVALSQEEREAFLWKFEIYASSEQSEQACRDLVHGFSSLDDEEIRSFSSDALIWYVDWLHTRIDLTDSGALQGLLRIWQYCQDATLRTRTIGVLLRADLGQERPAAESFVVTLFQREVMQDNEQRPNPYVVNGFLETLLTEAIPMDEGRFARAVLGECLRRLRPRTQGEYEQHVWARLQELGEETAHRYMDEILGER